MLQELSRNFFFFESKYDGQSATPISCLGGTNLYRISSQCRKLGEMGSCHKKCKGCNSTLGTATASLPLQFVRPTQCFSDNSASQVVRQPCSGHYGVEVQPPCVERVQSICLHTQTHNTDASSTMTMFDNQ